MLVEGSVLEDILKHQPNETVCLYILLAACVLGDGFRSLADSMLCKLAG